MNEKIKRYWKSIRGLRFNLGAGIVLALGIILLGSTFAWYSVSTTPSVQELKVSMSTTNILEIARATDDHTPPPEVGTNDEALGDTTWGQTVTSYASEGAIKVAGPATFDNGEIKTATYDSTGRMADLVALNATTMGATYDPNSHSTSGYSSSSSSAAIKYVQNMLAYADATPSANGYVYYKNPNTDQTMAVGLGFWVRSNIITTGAAVGGSGENGSGVDVSLAISGVKADYGGQELDASCMGVVVRNRTENSLIEADYYPGTETFQADVYKDGVSTTSGPAFVAGQPYLLELIVFVEGSTNTKFANGSTKGGVIAANVDDGIYISADHTGVYDNVEECKKVVDPSQSETVVTGTGITWSYYDGVLSVSGTGAIDDYNKPEDRPWAAYCNRATSIKIGDGITSIGKNAFYNMNRATTVDLGNGVQTLASGSFANCFSLNSINIPASVTSISDTAFQYCSNISSITVASGNTTYDSRDNCNAIVRKSDNTIIRGCYNSTVSDTVTGIANYAFDSIRNCTIKVPATVTSIATNAFYNYSGITLQVNVGSTALAYAVNKNIPYTLIDGGTVIASGNLTSTMNWMLDDAGLLSITGTGAMPDFADYLAEPWINYKDSITAISIGSGITGIGNFAFTYCDHAKSVTIPSTVTSIGNWAFAYCGVTKLNIPGSVKTIGDYGIYSCTFMTSLTLNSGLTTIGKHAFENDLQVAELTIPSTVTTINDDAFKSCQALTTVTIPKTVTTINDTAFDNCGSINFYVYHDTAGETFCINNGYSHTYKD